MNTEKRGNDKAKRLLRAGVAASALLLAGNALANYRAPTLRSSTHVVSEIAHTREWAKTPNIARMEELSISNYMRDKRPILLNGVVVSVRPTLISGSVARDGLGGELVRSNSASTYNVKMPYASEEIGGYIETFGGTATSGEEVFNIEHIAGSKSGYKIDVSVGGKSIYVEQSKDIAKLRPGEKVTLLVGAGNKREIPAMVIPRS